MSENFVTNLSDLSATNKQVIEANAKSQGITAEQYLASRGGVNPVTGKYGDSYDPIRDLTDAEYLAAKAGKTGTAAGAAINAATAAKASGTLTTSGGAGNTGTGLGGYGATGPTTAQLANRSAVTTALADFTASLSSAGLGGLVDTINKWILEDKTAAQIAIDIKKESVYKNRFPGMESLAKAGKAVNEATYISMERGMIGILKAYGLDDKVLGTTEKLGEVIGGLVNVQEYENRVQLAADHVKKNADVLANLKEYYGVDTAGAMSYLLDPKVGMDVVNKQVRAAEIGAASDLYNFNLDAGAAESFINAAGTADLNALKQEFGKARLLANTQARLSAIEGYQYKDTEAVAATLGNDQLKMLESQKRAEREVARYSGGSGIGQGSLKQASLI